MDPGAQPEPEPEPGGGQIEISCGDAPAARGSPEGRWATLHALALDQTCSVLFDVRDVARVAQVFAPPPIRLLLVLLLVLLLHSVPPPSPPPLLMLPPAAAAGLPATFLSPA